METNLKYEIFSHITVCHIGITKITNSTFNIF